MVSGGYYFFIASKSGADRRVMGIALAIETAPRVGWFFCLHLTIYTLGVLWIKPTAAGLGSCASAPVTLALARTKTKAGRIACNNTAVISSDQAAL